MTPQQAARDIQAAREMRDLCRHAERLCKRVAAVDLDALPLYVCDAASVDFSPGEWLRGLTSPTLADILKPKLGSRWAGRGIAIVVNVEALRLNPRGRFEHDFLAVALHELSHVLSEDYPGFIRQPFESALTVNDLTEHFLADPLGENSTAHKTARILDSHRPETFGRVALHCQHRAELLGVRLGPYRIWQRSAAFAAAIGDEPARLASMPFAEIMKQPLPAAYADCCNVAARYLAATLEREIENV